MASPNTPIPFTVGDQERLVKMEELIQATHDCVKGITHECTQTEKIDSLIMSRDNWYKGLRAGLVGIIVSAGIALFSWLFAFGGFLEKFPTPGM